MSIPCKMRPAGLESLPMGYTRLEYIQQPPLVASIGYVNAYIATDVTLSDDMEVMVDYTPVNLYWYNSELWLLGNAANGVIVNEGSQFSMIVYTHKEDTMKWGGTSYTFKFPSVGTNIGERHVLEVSKGQVIVDGQISRFNVLNELNSTNTVVLGTCRRAYSNENRLHGARIKKGGVVVASYAPALDRVGKPCMFDTIGKKTFYNGAVNEFIAGLTMGQALNLANLPVPTTSNTLTISLPKEATLVQYNQEVNAAIAAAEGKGWSITVQYRDKFDDESILNKYAECVTVADIKAVNPDYRNDLTEDGEWIYPLSKWERVQWSDPTFMQGSPIKSIDMEFPAMTTCGDMFRNATKLETARISLPAITTGTFRGLFEACTALKSFYVSAPNAKQCVALLPYTKIEEVTPDDLYAPQATSFDFFAHMSNSIKKVSFDFSNANSLYFAFSGGSLLEFSSNLPNLSDGRSAFQSCKLNKESALRILNTIPTWTSGTHQLTIGIHVDHQNDEEVLAAIALADIAQTPVADGGKGWTLTVQWRGTPTAQAASTFGLRKPPIYAKLGTVELPDGTIENFLDWGHYVTNWEENGYNEFTSLEEAYEHFNLEMPAED